MKKFRIVLLAFCLTVYSIPISAPKMILAQIPVVGTNTPEKVSYVQYINCTGEVIEEDYEDIILDIPVITSAVHVKVGDTVTVGQKLIDVDQAATIKTLANQSNDVVSVFLSSQSSNISMELISKLLSEAELTEALIERYMGSGAIPTSIYSTATGVVTAVYADEGSMTSALSTIVRISRSTDKLISLAVSESNISKVKIDQAVTITGVAFPDTTYTGRVVSIAPVARKTISGTSIETVIDVTVRLDEQDVQLKTGYTANGRIAVTDTKKVMTVPYEYVLQDVQGNEYVFVYENGRAVKRIIKTGLELSSGVECLEGLLEDDLIITSPSVLTPNMYVTLDKEVEQ